MENRRRFMKTGATFMTALPVLYPDAKATERDLAYAGERFDPGQKLVRDGLSFAKKMKKNNVLPVLREEILDNPRAVFLIRTSVSSQKDEQGKFPADRDQFAFEGYRAARRMFSPGTETGGTTYIKPNFVGGFGADERSLNNGVSTHPWFVAGFCDALKEMGNRNIVVGANGAASHQNFVESGICELFHERDVCFTEGKYDSYRDYKRSELTWVDYPDGIVMRRIPFFKLAKEKDTMLINMAKDRIHNLGFTTLTIKNIQGVMPVGYMHICGGWGTELNRGTEKNVFNPGYRQAIEKMYIRHANEGFKHWDEGGFSKAYFDAGGWEAFQRGDFKPDYKVFWVEQWANRMLDIDTNIHPHVNMVEGIVGVDGGGTLHLNNFITISRGMVECDAVSAWLMGQDPRALPYLRIAKERGFGQNDIERIDIYNISDRGISRIRDYRTLERARMGVRIFNLKGVPLRFF